MHRHLLALALLLSVSLASAQDKAEKAPKRGARAYPPNLPGAKIETYKTIGDVKLNLYIFNPDGHKPTDKRHAVVFFFGGGWTNGSPGQFEQHCLHLAQRGLIAITADYRVASRHEVKAAACVADAKSAIRYVRKEASRLGIDPSKIAASGGSAGGHLAACTGVVSGFDESSEDLSISSVPNALALFNPAVVLAPVEGLRAANSDRITALEGRMGVDPKKLSPYHHVRAGLPPTIIFHGTADTAVPFATVELFTKAMIAAGNDCRLVSYEGQPHGFFNHGRNNDEYYDKTLRELDTFLDRVLK